MSEQQNSAQGAQGQTIIINQPSQNSNGLGIAGFICSLLTLFLGWIPVFGWILWVLGLIFSLIGIFKSPKGFAVAGLVISLIGFILLVFVFAALAAAFAS
jgi:hypothetical protein